MKSLIREYILCAILGALIGMNGAQADEAPSFTLHHSAGVASPSNACTVDLAFPQISEEVASLGVSPISNFTR